jgi:hypothetical protein
MIFELAVVDPPLLVAVTELRTNLPATSALAIHGVPVAPRMSVQVRAWALGHTCHLTAVVVVGSPFISQVPRVLSIELPIGIGVEADVEATGAAELVGSG